MLILQRSVVHRGPILWSALVLCFQLSAQSWQVFNTANAGLPSNSIIALAEDHDGIIWAATDWGLCRYDGLEWSVIQESPGGLSSNSLRSLAVDEENRLWVGTDLYGIAILDDDSWSYITMDDSPLPDNTINAIHHDHRGWVWIGTPAGLACITPDGWRVYNDTPDSYGGFEFFSPHIRDVVVREDELVCVATMNGGLTYLTEEDHIYYTSYNSAFFDNSANAIALDGNGDRWLASAAAGIIWHAGPHLGGPWFNYSVQNSGFPDNTITSIVIDADNKKYAGTEVGGIIVQPDAGPWSVIDTTNSDLPDARIQALLLDQYGDLWAGTYSGGVAKMEISTGIQQQGITGPHVYPVPFYDHIWVEMPGVSSPMEWRLHSATGSCVAKGHTHMDSRMRLDLPGSQPGTYYLSIIGPKTSWSVKLIRLSE